MNADEHSALFAPDGVRARRLARTFYERDAITVAQELLGKCLVHVEKGCQQIARIVEVEADLAAHSAKGRTPRTEVMFGPPGYAYVYLVYGMHHCMNVVTGPDGCAAAVLLRAAEPVQNILRRTTGPGLICAAFGIDRRYSGHDLLSDTLFIAAPAQTEGFGVVRRPRIGVDYAGHWAKRLLRFYIKGNAFVSKP